MIKIFKILILFAIIIVPFYYFREDFTSLRQKAEQMFFYKPCVEPIAYRFAAVDARFGISDTDFYTAVKEAENLWENASGRNLFVSRPEGKLAISLAYDYRQNTTEKLNTLDQTLVTGKNTYEKLKTEYEARLKAYNDKAALITSRTRSYNKEAAAYENEVRRYNRAGGAPPDVYETLTAKRAELDGELNAIRSEQSSANELASQINDLAHKLNKLIVDYNLNVKQYNTIGESLPDEYEQGNYSGSLEGGEIVIYQYANRDKLVRVLAHEFGHALGIDHLTDPEDIMYSLNVGSNDKITAADLSALDGICATPSGWENILNRLKSALPR